MKAIVCEMCSSHDVVKQDGFYVCQSCGTKYSTEDAKKLMVEISGSVDVSGSTVKVDKNETVEKYLQLARRARKEGNSANAAKYYEMVNTERPDDWESSFYSVYYTAAECKIGQIDSAASSVYNSIPSAMSLIKKKVPAADQKAAYMEIVNSVRNLWSMFVKAATDHAMKFASVQGSNAEMKSRVKNAYNMLKVSADCIWKEFKDKETAISLYEMCAKELDPTVINQLIAQIDPARGVEMWKAQNKKVLTNIFVYLIFAVAFFVFSGFLGDLAWIGIVFGVVFGAIGLIHVWLYFYNKKTYINK